MTKVIIISNSPTPHNINSAAHEVGCSPATLRNYIRRGDLIVPRVPSGQFVFFDHQIRKARALYEKNRRG